MKTLSILWWLAPLLIYPASASNQRHLVTHQPVVVAYARDEIPTIAFCEMVKNPQLYFDKSIRLTAMLEQAEEGQYLSDEKCVLSHDEQIGVGYPDTDEKQRDLRNQGLEKLHSAEYGNRARVTVIGILRNASRRDFAWYHYRFDIIRFEDISHVIVPYQGTLQAGITYRAVVRSDSRAGLSFIIPLHMPEHYAVRVEWMNLREFPALQRLHRSSDEKQIVFSVMSDQTRQMTAQRWNETIRCKIISVE